MMNRHLPERQRVFQPEGTAFATGGAGLRNLWGKLEVLGSSAGRQKIRLQRVFHPKEFGICPKENEKPQMDVNPLWTQMVTYQNINYSL